MTKEIKLTKGYVALVDDVDFELVNQFKWYWTHGYAKRDIKINGKKIRIYMHRLIANPSDGYHVDHIDGNTLNNCRSNLRQATNKQNIRNQPKNRPNTTSKYKGVYFCKVKRKWTSRVCVNYKSIYLGYFENEDDAALAYNFGAEKHFGKFANYNVVE